MTGFDPAVVATRFRDFARSEQGSLYGRLAAKAAEDPLVVGILDAAPAGQRRPVLLFAAVHHLLLGGVDHPLREAYASLVPHPSAGDPWPEFRSFVAENRAALRAIVSSRNTQTNEVGRTVALLPAVAVASGGGPVGLVECGASAGLNLLMERFAIRTAEGRWGPVDAAIELTCTVEPPLRPPFPDRLAVASRAGLDLHPVDLLDEEAVRWLRACVWPEDRDRADLLAAAVELGRAAPPPVVEGDMVHAVGQLLDAVPLDVVPVVYHSWALTYLPRDRRAGFADQLRAAAARRDRPVEWVSMEGPSVVPGFEPPGGDDPARTVLAWSTVRPDGTVEHRHLAEAHPHGRWIRWVDPATAAVGA